MRKLLAMLTVVVACLGLIASPASAATTLTYYETVAPQDVQFIPACVPGPENPACDPRGPGSVLISTGTLSATQDGPVIGSVYTKCTTTRKVGADYYGFCLVVLTTPQGRFIGVGEINETGLERYEAQQLTLVGARGSLTVQQIVYPNVFRLTVRLG
jgi:hypothetical protein